MFITVTPVLQVVPTVTLQLTWYKISSQLSTLSPGNFSEQQKRCISLKNISTEISMKELKGKLRQIIYKDYFHVYCTKLPQSSRNQREEKTHNCFLKHYGYDS